MTVGAQELAPRASAASVRAWRAASSSDCTLVRVSSRAATLSAGESPICCATAIWSSRAAVSWSRASLRSSGRSIAATESLKSVRAVSTSPTASCRSPSAAWNSSALVAARTSSSAVPTFAAAASTACWAVAHAASSSPTAPLGALSPPAVVMPVDEAVSPPSSPLLPHAARAMRQVATIVTRRSRGTGHLRDSEPPFGRRIVPRPAPVGFTPIRDPPAGDLRARRRPPPWAGAWPAGRPRAGVANGPGRDARPPTSRRAPPRGGGR